MPHTDRTLPRPTTGAERRLILAARRGDATAQARVLSQVRTDDAADRRPSRDMAVALDLQAAYEATAPRRERVRMPAADRPGRGDDDPVVKTLAREQLRALIARTRTLSPLDAGLSRAWRLASGAPLDAPAEAVGNSSVKTVPR